MALPEFAGQWQPEQTTLKELAGYLRSALNPRDAVAQKQATLVIALPIF